MDFAIVYMRLDVREPARVITGRRGSQFGYALGGRGRSHNRAGRFRRRDSRACPAGAA